MLLHKELELARVKRIESTVDGCAVAPGEELGSRDRRARRHRIVSDIWLFCVYVTTSREVSDEIII